MKMSLVVDGLRSDVISVGELGDDTVAEAAELPDGRVEIRVAGDDVDLAYVEDVPTRTADFEGIGEGDRERDRDMSARITLRLSESLKARVEEGAERQGISVNAFIVRTLEHGAASEHKRRSYARNRLRGYGTT